MVSFLDFEGSDPSSAAQEAAEAITAARTAAQERGIKSFLFAAASAEEFDQRAQFGEVPDILDEVADKYLGSPDQRAKLTATLRREFVAVKTADAMRTCPNCQHMWHDSICPGYPNCGCDGPSSDDVHDDDDAEMRGDVFQVMGPNVRTYVHPKAGCSADGQEQVVDADQTALGAGPVCPHCQVRFSVKPEDKTGSTKQASDPCGGCPAGTKCVCTHDGCKCVKTSKVVEAEGAAGDLRCEQCDKLATVLVSAVRNDPFGGRPSCDDHVPRHLAVYTTPVNEAGQQGVEDAKDRQFSDEFNLRLGPKGAAQKTAEEKGDYCENCGAHMAQTDVHACNNCDVAICGDCAKGHTCPYCGANNPGYYDWNTGDHLSSKTAMQNCPTCGQAWGVCIHTNGEAPKHIDPVDHTAPKKTAGTTPCPECGGPAEVWADKSQGVTVNFACDNEKCASGKPPWDMPRPSTKTAREDDPRLNEPKAYALCPTCDGRGSHVNPSIDYNGLPDDYASDPDFMEDYMGGQYDVRCAECHGNRVVPRCSHPGCEEPAEQIERAALSGDHRDKSTGEHQSTCYNHLSDEEKEDRQSYYDSIAENEAELRMGA